MKKKVCKNCRQEVDKKATVCGSCGKKIKKPFYKKWWFWVIVVVVFIGAVSGSSDETESLSNNDANTQVSDRQSEKSTKDSMVVKSIGDFEKEEYFLEVGDKVELSATIKPNGITEEDAEITNTDDSVIKISNIKFTDKGDKTKLTFTTHALKSGSCKISVISSDGKTRSDEISFSVKEKETSSTESNTSSIEKDTSRTVYITPTGEKYHFSSSCAGKNATSTTLNKAKASGYEACKKCAD